MLSLLLGIFAEEDLYLGSASRHLLEEPNTPNQVKRGTRWGYGILGIVFAINLAQLITFAYLRRHVAINKRRPNLVLLSGVFTLLFYFHVGLNLCFAQDSRLPVYKHHLKRALPTVFFFLQFWEGSAHMTIAYRMHLLWFDLGLASAFEDLQWQLHLDDASERSNFYLKNRRTLGNKLYARVYAAFWVVVFSVAGAWAIAFRGYKFSKLSRSFIGLNLWLPMAHLFITCLLLPRFQDLWHVRDEVYVTVVPPMCVALTWYVYSMELSPHPPTEEYAIWSTFGCFSHFLAICAQTTWVQWSNNLPLTPWNAEMLYRLKLKHAFESWTEPLSRLMSLSTTVPPKDINMMHSPDANSLATDVSVEMMPPNVAHVASGEPLAGERLSARRPRAKSKGLRMARVLADESGLILICRHMTREFSSENILFLIETEQFLDFMKQTLADKLQADDKSLDIPFSKTAPRSRLVADDADDVYEKACRLFLKYVQRSNELLELNISYPCQNALYNRFSFEGGAFEKWDTDGNITEATANTSVAAEWLAAAIGVCELFHVFDDARREVFTLVRDSFSRFVRTEDYAEWAQFRQEDIA